MILPKVVLDSNVIVSALLVKQGKPAQIILLAQQGHFQCILSKEILAEVRRIAYRKHIQKKYHPTQESIEQLLGILQTWSTWVEVKQVENVIPNDPPDNFVLACAVEGEADYLVSGNLHFVNLKAYRNIKMVTPAQFLNILHSL